MTITESITAWLHGYAGGIEAGDLISTDQLAAAPSEGKVANPLGLQAGEAGRGRSNRRFGSRAFGVFKAPGDTVREFVDGSRDVTAHFLFLARQPSQTDGMRVGNQAWLEDFERWVRAENMARNLPQLDESRSCYAVNIAGSFAMETQTESESVYQITLAISYFEEARE